MTSLPPNDPSCTTCGGTNPTVQSATLAPGAIKSKPPIRIGAPAPKITPIAAEGTKPLPTRKTPTSGRAPAAAAATPAKTTPKATAATTPGGGQRTEAMMKTLLAQHHEQTTRLRAGMSDKLEASLGKLHNIGKIAGTAAAVPPAANVASQTQSTAATHAERRRLRAAEKRAAATTATSTSTPTPSGDSKGGEDEDNPDELGGDLFSSGLGDLKSQSNATLASARSQIEQLTQTVRSKMQGLGANSAAGILPGFQPVAPGTAANAAAAPNAAGPLPSAVGQGVQDVQQQQMMLKSLEQQLTQWGGLTEKMVDFKTYMGAFGKQVQLFLGVQDDSRHYSVQHHRGPLLTLLDNDSARWYRTNDVQKSMANARCKLVWQGSAPDSNGGGGQLKHKRFQLEWHDVLLDSQQRIVVIGTCWNALTQRLSAALARFSPDGQSLDPSFCSDPKNAAIGYVQHQLFQTESKGVQIAQSADTTRLLALCTVTDHESQQLIGTICAIKPSNGQIDATFGHEGAVGLSVDGYKGCVAVRMAVHPVTGDILVLLRLQTQNESVNRLVSLFHKLKSDGSVDANFKPVFLGGGGGGESEQTWMASDICWQIGIARNDDRILVVGTRVRNSGGEYCDPFVNRYLPDGTADVAFGPLTAAPVSSQTRTPTECGDSSAPSAAAPDVITVNMSKTAEPALPPLQGKDPKETTALWFHRQMDRVIKYQSGDAPVKPIDSTKLIGRTAGVTAGAGGGSVVVTGLEPVAIVQRVLTYKDGIEIVGTAYQDVQGSRGATFWVRLDLNGNTVGVRGFEIPEHQATVAQNFTIDETTGTRLIVGYALRSAFKIDSADAMYIKFGGEMGAEAPQQFRLSLGGEHYQTLTAAVHDAEAKRFVTVGLVQSGRTVYTRLATVLFGPPSST
jgi:hypothetical protein